MAVICFANSGDSSIGGLAARIVEAELSESGARVCLYNCLESDHRQASNDDAQLAEKHCVSSRQFINDVRRLESGHDHLVIDLAATSEVISAIAFSMADLVLVPLRTSHFDQATLRKTFGILETVSVNRRRPLEQAVFMTSESNLLSPQMVLSISGLLMLRGFRTLPVGLVEQWADVYLEKHAGLENLIDFACRSMAREFVGNVMERLAVSRSSMRSSA